MERLTIPDIKIDGGTRRTVIDPRKVKEYAMTIYWALKKYEDTGLTPEQIIKIQGQSSWIPVEDRLPEERINSITNDFYEYQVTAKFREYIDVRHYKFGRGHWWHGPAIVDKYVIAWQPIPEPYNPRKDI